MSLKKFVKEELSGSVAKSYVAQISCYNRIQGSTMFHEAAEYVRNELVMLGLKDAAIEQFPADGAHKYWTYTSPVGWDVKSAELRLVEPGEKLLAVYEDLPQSLHTYSNGTPADGVTAELVDVGSGIKASDYKGKDVKGKFVLARGRAQLVHEQAVYKFGAAGVITDTITYEMPSVRESIDIPDAHAYQAIWPDADELHKAAFGFSLSKRQGNELRALLEKKKTVKLEAKVDARLFPSKMDIVTATIKGESKPKEEVFLIAHLCHPKPSANDNASGAGLLLEIARTIKTLIDRGKLQRPARTIRFFWVPETHGTVAYLCAHKDASSRLVAGIDLDMVGQNQELCKSTLNLDRTPDSLPSYLNDYVFSLIEQSIGEFGWATQFGLASTFRYASTPFSGGSDHAEFVEATTKVPCVMLLQWPDVFYHTSMDTVDKVSEDSLKRVGWIATVAVFKLANADAETAFQLANQVVAGATARIAQTAGKAAEELFEKEEDKKFRNQPKMLAKELANTMFYYRFKLKHIIKREKEAVKSVRRLGGSSKLQSFIDKHCKEIEAFGQNQGLRLEEILKTIAKSSGLKLPLKPDETRSEKECKKLVPKRLFKGSLSRTALRKALGEKEHEWYLEIEEKDIDFYKKAAEVINFMDGKRTAYDIVKSVSSEYGRTETEELLKFLRDLKKIGLVTFK
jgi:aminopeptidase YwaD